MTEPSRSLRSILLDCLEYIESSKRISPRAKTILAEGHAALIEEIAPCRGRPQELHNAQIIEMANAGKSTAEIVAAFTSLPRSTIDSTLKRWRCEMRRTLK